VLKGNLSLVGPRRTPSHAKAENVFMTRRSTAISRATGSSPGSPVGADHGWRGETDTHEKSSAGSSTISTTSRNWSVLLGPLSSWEDADRARPDRERVLMSTIAGDVPVARHGTAPPTNRCAGRCCAHRISPAPSSSSSEPLRDRSAVRHDRPFARERLTLGAAAAPLVLSLVLANIGYAMAVVQVMRPVEAGSGSLVSRRFLAAHRISIAAMLRPLTRSAGSIC